MEKFCVYGKLIAKEGKAQELAAYMKKLSKKCKILILVSAIS